MDCSTPGFPVFHYLREFAQTQVHCVVMPSNHLILCPDFNRSQHGCLYLMSQFFTSWPKYWSFSFSISPSIEYSGLISFRIDWFDLPAFQGNLKSLLQHHSSKASIICYSTFLMVQLSYSNMTTGKTIALTRLMFVGKLTSLLFNMLSRCVITFLPELNVAIYVIQLWPL